MYKLCIILSQCGELFCHKETNADNEEVTIFTGRHACRRTLILYYQLKTTHLRFNPIVDSKSVAERAKVGCNLEIVGCVDNGKLGRFKRVMVV